MRDVQLPELTLAAKLAAEYRAGVATKERTPVENYAAVHRAFSTPLPESGRASEAVIEELARLAGPGIRAQAGPRFFGWVIGNSHPTGVAADWLTSAWGQNAANVIAAPAASAVEAVAADWLLDLLGLPKEASVGFTTGATVANTICLGAARGALLQKTGWDAEEDGLFGAPSLPVLIGEEAHATVFVALKLLGLGSRRVTIVACDELGRMLPGALAEAIAQCDAPPLVIAQAGQINTGACDPFDVIAPMVKDAGGWLHVDGAFGLWAQAAPQRAHLTRGVELADSWATDGHKWLQTPYDSGFAIVRNADAHRRAMAVSASYLPPASAGERDPSSYVPELSRRARGFSTWAMIRHLGRSGVAEMVEGCCQIATLMSEGLAKDEGVDLVAPVSLNQFMLRFGDDDDLTLAVVKAVQEDAIAYIGASQWRGQWVMRISISSIATTKVDAEMTMDSIRRCWDKVRAGQSGLSQ